MMFSVYLISIWLLENQHMSLNLCVSHFTCNVIYFRVYLVSKNVDFYPSGIICIMKKGLCMTGGWRRVAEINKGA